MKQLYKRYIKVKVMIDKHGEMTPLSIYWENDIEFVIDRVTRVSQSASLVGGAGLKFECLIKGQRRVIFKEHTNQWFIESEKP